MHSAQERSPLIMITSLRFWYVYGAEGARTKSAVVLVEDGASSKRSSSGTHDRNEGSRPAFSGIAR